jgi:hypothetical protein
MTEQIETKSRPRHEVAANSFRKTGRSLRGLKQRQIRKRFDVHRLLQKQYFVGGSK